MGRTRDADLCQVETRANGRTDERTDGRRRCRHSTYYRNQRRTTVARFELTGPLIASGGSSSSNPPHPPCVNDGWRRRDVAAGVHQRTSSQPNVTIDASWRQVSYLTAINAPTASFLYRHDVTRHDTYGSRQADIIMQGFDDDRF